MNPVEVQVKGASFRVCHKVIRTGLDQFAELQSPGRFLDCGNEKMRFIVTQDNGNEWKRAVRSAHKVFQIGVVFVLWVLRHDVRIAGRIEPSGCPATTPYGKRPSPRLTSPLNASKREYPHV
jgi:hypothetical protein